MEVYGTDDDDDAWKKSNLINVSALSLITAASTSTFAITLLLWPTKSSRTLNQMWVSKCRHSLSIVEYMTSPNNLLFNLYSLSLYEERPHNEFYEYCGVVLNQKNVLRVKGNVRQHTEYISKNNVSNE